MRKMGVSVKLIHIAKMGAINKYSQVCGADCPSRLQGEKIKNKNNKNKNKMAGWLVGGKDIGAARRKRGNSTEGICGEMRCGSPICF